MEVGTPFIISDLPDVRSAFGQATEYVPPDNPPQLAEKLSALHQPECYRSLRNRCLAHRSNFDFDWVGEFESELKALTSETDSAVNAESGLA
jgi:glycosyltransferase involved in cell wall biosynthesis